MLQRVRASKQRWRNYCGLMVPPTSTRVSRFVQFQTAARPLIVKAAQSCGPILAEQLSGITGRIFLSYEPSFVLFPDSIPRVLAAAERA
jgi:hypothetical protein